MNERKRVILTACSNQLDSKFKQSINQLKSSLEALGLIVDLSNNIFKTTELTSSPIKRANEFNDILKVNKHDYIIDVSGGDLSNEIIPFISLDYLRNFKGTYVGYSDLTTIIALFTKENKQSIYFNIKTLLEDKNQEKWIKNIFLNKNIFNGEDLNFLNIKFIKGRSVKGKVVGGNIRCLLKLAGTEFMPNSNDKILFLESYSGNLNRIRSYLTQYEMLGVFKNCNGILLGQFTEVDNSGNRDVLIKLFSSISTKYNIPLIETLEVGHSNNTKAIVINSYIDLKKSKKL